MYNINNIINNLVLFLIIYLPFESFFLKIISFNSLSFFIFSQLPDISIFFLFFVKLFISNKYFNYHKIFAFFIVFLSIYTFIVTTYWGSDLFTSTNNLKAFLRYIFLIFLINEKSLKFLETFLKAIIISGVLQVTIGLIQIIIGQPALTFFGPYELAENDVFQNQFSFFKSGNSNIIGTSSQNINYALFLLITFLVNINYNKIFNRYVFYFLNLTIPVCVYFSGSRTVFLSLMICYFIHHLISNTLAKKLLFFIPFTSFILATIFLFDLQFISSSYKDFSFIFSKNLIAALEVQRLGILQVLNENLLSINILGYSPDKYFLSEYMARNFQIPIQLKLTTLTLIEDIYLLAFFLYFGIINLLFLLMILYYVYIKITSAEITNNSYKKLSSLTQNTLLITLILNLFNQAFEIRLYSFYFWLFISIILFTLSTKNESSFST